MGWRSSTLGLAALLLVLLVGLAAGTGAVWGAFSASTVSAGNEVRSAPDFVAPLTSAATVQKATGGTPGFVRSGSSYRIFAAVTDSGRPSSGIAQVSTGTNGGVTGTALTAGTYPAVGGVTYTHRSAQQTFGTIPAGTYGFAMGATDGAGNGRTQTGFSYTVDNTAPAAATVSTANHTGGIVGRPEAGDTLTLTYSEPIDPISLVAGWEGQAATPVVVRIANDNVFFGPYTDVLTIYNAGNTTVLPTGSIDLGRSDYVTTARTFGASGTSSGLTVSGNDVTVTLGTASGATTTSSSTGSLRWTPGSGSTDRAGNPLTSTAVVAEAGTADKDF
jgi:hypothetical protein